MLALRENGQQPYDEGDRVGLVLISVSFAVSLVACLALLCYIAYSASTISAGAKRYWTIATHVHYYFLSLMVSECVQAVGGIMTLRWVVEARVSEGSFCTIQGALKQVGDVGNALASLAIAINTFSIIVLKWTPPESPYLALCVIAAIWCFLLLVVAINAAVNKGYYGDTGDWCWITESYPVQRIATEYMFMWLTAFLNIILYALIALVINGWVVMNGWKVNVPVKSERAHLRLRGGRPSNVLARQMLFYPAIYTFTVLPIAVSRWVVFIKGADKVPFWATVLSDCIFALSGLLNVILFAITRPTLVPIRKASHGFISSVHIFTSDSSNSGRRHDPQAYVHTFDPNEEWRVAPRLSPINKIPPHPTFPPPVHKLALVHEDMAEPSAAGSADDEDTPRNSRHDYRRDSGRL